MPSGGRMRKTRLPKGGFGNLIALPLQGGPRRVGNSCFVDERLVPYPDQWRFLAELPVVSTEKLNQLRARAVCEHRALLPQTDVEVERLEPWFLFVPSDARRDGHGVDTDSARYLLPDGHLSDKIQITLGNSVCLRQTELTPSVRGKLIRLASFVNPKYAEMQCGPVRYRVDAKKMGNYSAFRHVVRVRPTPFVPRAAQLESEGRAVFADVVQEAMTNDARNALIVSDVLESMAEGRSPVVLSERREHLEILERLLAGKVAHLVLMRGGMGRKEMKPVRAELDAVPSSEARVILATGSYLGEGFDDARLDTLFLTLPISWKGRLIQYAGRLHRLCDGKKEVRIYDYVDMRVQMCRTMFNKRCAGYRAIGYEITMPDDRLKG